MSVATYLPAQYHSSLGAKDWVDSVYNSLNKKKRIAQLMIIRAHSNLGDDHVASVTELVKKYDVGGLCFFQGGPVRQATLTNYYQSIARTPLLITQDGEWGLGMRLDSVINFPRQMMIGAVQDGKVAYQVGEAIGAQCRRMGVQLNFAPVVDINNNPENPVINDRSFGEDKYRVASLGVQLMKGMQDHGVLASAKHFPGHGDVSVDSHLDLPVINKTRKQLDTLELYPFREMIKAGVASVMTAHLYIPSIDTTANLATSLSPNSVNGLLKNELGYKGLVITDGLEMKGVTKFFPAGDIAVQALAAGNDMLLLPEDVPGSIKKIRKAIRKDKIDEAAFETSVRKVLMAKYHAGLHHYTPVNVVPGLVDSLNAGTRALKRTIAENAITLVVNNSKNIIPLTSLMKLAYVGIGTDTANAFAKTLKNKLNASLYFFSYKKNDTAAQDLLKQLSSYDAVVIGMHAYSRRPANNFGISNTAYRLINKIQSQLPSVTCVFGNPYAIQGIASTANTLFACYEDDEVTQLTAVDILTGKLSPKGELPVTVSKNFAEGKGTSLHTTLPIDVPESVGLNPDTLNVIDSIANDAIARHATPGCVVLVAKDGKVVFDKGYGYTTYDSVHPITSDMIYDLASVTKISATTVAIMKLYEQGKLDLNKTLGDYLPWVRGSDKENLLIKNILLHQAGLKSWIPFYRETLDKDGYPLTNLYRSEASDSFSLEVAEGLYLRTDWRDTMYQRMLQSKLGPQNVYEYSDNDFIFLGKIVEALTGQPLEEYVREQFYQPLQMTTTAFHPKEHFPLDHIVPTERDKNWRQQMLHGDVHDPAAAMFGGVAGHAGLFSNAYDLAQLYQMLLNGGELGGVRYLKKETVDLFTGYNSSVSRRGLGFDKPEKDNDARPDPYPARGIPTPTFGHTGFTGICVWADPVNDLLYIFLSNRVSPDAGNEKLIRMKVRAKIQETIYKAMAK